MRSSMPPCPGNRKPESLRLAARLSSDSARSPAWATSPTSGPITSGMPRGHADQPGADAGRDGGGHQSAGQTLDRLRRADVVDQPPPPEPAAGQVGAGVVAPDQQQQRDQPGRAGLQRQSADRRGRAAIGRTKVADHGHEGQQQRDVGDAERGGRPGEEAGPRIGTRESRPLPAPARPPRRPPRGAPGSRSRDSRPERSSPTESWLAAISVAPATARPIAISTTCGGW